MYVESMFLKLQVLDKSILTSEVSYGGGARTGLTGRTA